MSKIKISITGETHEEVANVIAKLNATFNPSTRSAEDDNLIKGDGDNAAADKPKGTRKPRAAKEDNTALVKADTAPKGVVAKTTDPEPEDEAGEVDYEQVKDAVLALSGQKGGREKLVPILKKFGATHATELKEKDYAAVLAEITAATEEAPLA